MPYTNKKGPEEIAAFDRSVLHILLRHRSKANAIDRWKLVEEVFGEPVPIELQNDDHGGDRDIREAIHRLRLADHLILDMGNGAGRWMAATEKEFWDFYSYYAKPLKSRAEVLRSMRKTAERQFPNLLQPALFDLKELESL